MSLLNVCKDAVATAFDVVEDLLTSADFVALGTKTLSNGEYTTTGDVTDTANMLKYDFNSYEIDGQAIKYGDARFMVKESDLTQDKYNYVNVGSEKWDIVSMTPDPSNSVRIYHLRKVSG